LWDASEEQLKIIGTSGQVALDIDTGNFTVGAYGLTDAGAATIASMAANWTNAGRTVADAGILSTVDINGGTLGGITIDGNWTAASQTCADLGTVTTATSITSTAFVGGTISGTTIDASTDFTIGSTVITDDSIVMTPSASDTVTIAAASNGVLNLTTVDANAQAGHINVNADGNVNLQYIGSTKLNTISTGVEVTGTLDASSTVYGGGFKSSLEQAGAGDGIDLHSSATIRAKEDGGIYQDGDVIAASGTKLTSQNMENTNFRASDNNTVTAAIGAGDVHTIAFINLDNTSNNKYHAVEVECAFQEKITSTNVRTRWLSQKLYACYDGNTVEFRTDNTRFKNTLNNYAPGEFCAGLWTDSTDKYLTIGFCIYEEKVSSDRTATFGVNINGISMPVCLNS